MVPDFGGACLTNLMPALLGHIGEGADKPTLPTWMPAPVEAATQVVLLVIDGLGREQLDERQAIAPTLAAGGAATMTSVAPSTTAAALTSLVTGTAPAHHGVVGYRVALAGQIMNILQWKLGQDDARQRVPATTFQRAETFPGAPRRVPVVSRYDYAATGFTAAHLGQATLVPWYTPAGIPVSIKQLLDQGEPFVYAYYDGIDKVAHATGLGAHYEAELAYVDRLIGDVLAVLPEGAVLVVTADHGQVQVGSTVEVLGSDVMEGVVLLSGEGRFRWLHTRAGATNDVAAAAHAAFGDVAWIRTRDQIVADGWLGGEPIPDVMARLGDVVLAPFTPTAFLDPADTGEQGLVTRHGSLTAAEMRVPLLSWPTP
jgi:arylsulfatase A-like enzyme